MKLSVTSRGMQHPWLTERTRRRVQKHVTPDVAKRLLNSHSGQLKEELVTVGLGLRLHGDATMYARRMSMRNSGRSLKMSRALSTMLDEQINLCKCESIAHKKLEEAHRWDSCMQQISDEYDIYEYASLLLCCAHIVVQNGVRKTMHAREAFPSKRSRLAEILGDGSAAAVDGEFHVVRACVFSYCEHIDANRT
ncbi:hypothetical protein CYMTET_41325 [Cymbomonas tetramitiformis]|nr:hypothetical protein CYMTET_41325 [Cymbomonas tetramitiformis]